MARKVNITAYDIYDYIVETNCTHEECAEHFGIHLSLVAKRIRELPEDMREVLHDITTACRMVGAARAFGAYISNVDDPYEVAQMCYDYIMTNHCTWKECMNHFGLAKGRLRIIRNYLSEEQAAELDAQFKSNIATVHVVCEDLTAEKIYDLIVKTHCTYDALTETYGVSARTIARRISTLNDDKKAEIKSIQKEISRAARKNN